jgi:hypothetical protein
VAQRFALQALCGILALAASAGLCVPARAIDFGFGPVDFGQIGSSAPPPAFEAAPEGPVACSIGAPPWNPTPTAQTLPWDSVWLGHFAGGRPDPVFYGQVDWLDVKVCFASKARCQAWIKDLRHAYHRPEGYWTCLLLR